MSIRKIKDFILRSEVLRSIIYKIRKISYVQDIRYRLFPRCIAIEISGICNAKCLYCCQGSGNHKAKNTFMIAEEFEKIIHRLLYLKLIKPAYNGNIGLFNWGEPFLNPQLNDILRILGSNNLKAGISSNFIKKPNITPENYKNIDSYSFSLCSLNPKEYERIYGAKLEMVMENFNEFVKNRNQYNPNLKIIINWLRYQFNENEFIKAKEYFMKKGADEFADNMYAYINDGYAWIKYLNIGILEGYDIEQICADIDFKRLNFVLGKAPANHYCSIKDMIVINESSELTLCCTITSKNQEYNLGDIHKLSRLDIFRLKARSKICKQCEKAHLNYFYLNGYIKDLAKFEDCK
ncbi:MAG: radical SAM protein [Endomicrobium sp.]|nr:radical SAM protein [Endomicrobium sp.]